jgi:SSS family solute:Na+ symporter
MLRRSITGVAIFVFIFGALFPQTEFIVMWWMITMAIYVGGAGAVIIGGLYWKKGTTAAAWTALITGSGLSVGGIITRAILKNDFPLNGMEISFYSCIIAMTLYVVVSLLTCKEDFNMDRMLHRGKYAKVTAVLGDPRPPEPNRRRSWLARAVGIDKNFTKADKVIAFGLLGWGLFWFVVFIVGTAWNLLPKIQFFADLGLEPWSEETWKKFWYVAGIGIPVFMSLLTAVWFTWGGTRDIFRLFKHLKAEVVNELDDGTVVGHQNLDDAAVTHEPAGATQDDKIHPDQLPGNRK